MARKVVHDSTPASFNINITIKSNPDLLTYSCQATSNSDTYGPSSRLQMYRELWTSEYSGYGLLLRLVGGGSVEGLGKEAIRGLGGRGRQSGDGADCLPPRPYSIHDDQGGHSLQAGARGTVGPAMGLVIKGLLVVTSHPHPHPHPRETVSFSTATAQTEVL